jgi:transposase
MKIRPGQVFMQDRAKAHSARDTQLDLAKRRVYPIFWPPFSPNINPIEAVWNQMKN